MAATSSDHGDVIQWFVSKVSRYSSDPVLRHVFTAGSTTIDVADVVNSGKVLIALIPESAIGATAARTISKWIMMQLRDAIKQRGLIPRLAKARDYNVFAKGGATGAPHALPMTSNRPCGYRLHS